MKPIITPILICLFLNHTACQPKQPIKSPEGYDFTRPIVFKMPKVLDEISGITFLNGKNDTVYAVQDEEGMLYKYIPEDGTTKGVKFAKKGDYEDVAINDNHIIVLKSDGSLLTYPLSYAAEKAEKVSEIKNILPKGEYEGLYADDAKHVLYALCKDCKGDKQDKKVTGFILKIKPDGQIQDSSFFTLDVKAIEIMAGVKKMHFQPSALARHTVTNEWYILASANNALVITDADWRVKAAYPMPKSHFRQPEGIAFDNVGNLYISNERASSNNGNILKFMYQKTN
jgi:SdiA-regulated